METLISGASRSATLLRAGITASTLAVLTCFGAAVVTADDFASSDAVQVEVSELTAR